VWQSTCGRALLEHHAGRGRTGPGHSAAAQWHVTVDGEQVLDLHGRPWKRRNEETAKAKALAVVIANGPTRWERRDGSAIFDLRCGPMAAEVTVCEDGGAIVVLRPNTKRAKAIDIDRYYGLEDVLDIVLDTHALERRSLPGARR